ncbi:MAG: nucleotidyltransferase family protein [Methylococcales bacterium]|nr:nucleotidyltransferase family protein [Methylococcales bacterium]
MQAIILAGGFGTRLQSVVKDVPKPMAAINGYPFLKYLLDSLAKQGFTKIILSVGYKQAIIKHYFKDRYLEMEIVYASEDSPLGTGGAIVQALKLTDSHCVYVLNGDSFFEVDLQRMKESHLTSKADITLATKVMTDFDRYGTVVLNRHRVIHFEEKKYHAEGLINAGIYCINPTLFDGFQTELKFSFETDFLEKYLQKLWVNSFESTGYFIDIGIPDDYQHAHHIFSE